MKKEFPFKKVSNKIDELCFRLEEWEREDNSRGNFYNQRLLERIDQLETELNIQTETRTSEKSSSKMNIKTLTYEINIFDRESYIFSQRETLYVTVEIKEEEDPKEIAQEIQEIAETVLSNIRRKKK